MTSLTGNSREQFIKGMFSGVASNYDRMNQLMTFGQHNRWKRITILKTNLSSEKCLLLDLGGGTGDLSRKAIEAFPKTISVVTDFSLPMMQKGQKRTGSQGLRWLAGDAMNLPYSDEVFDAIVSGFLLRNVVNLPRVINEQYRVLKPGGRLVSLETNPLDENKLKPFLHFYIHRVIPLLGQLISRNRSAYNYLANSSEKFMSSEEIIDHMKAVGLKDIGCYKLNFGTIAIHWGEK
jgi:demethylmenaquinone methyltransferase/2-methoxy-6-polyprenyl-1,4-benzoquinol methylase